MNAGRSARWSTRFLALAMLIVAWFVFRVLASQLERIGEAAERADSRAGSRASAPAADAPAQPPTASLPRPGQARELAEEGDPFALDSERGSPGEDRARAAQEEALPQPGRIPEGAVW